MRQKHTGRSSERIIKDIKPKTRRQYSAEEKICIVLDGVRGWKRLGEAYGVRIAQIEIWMEQVNAQIMPNLEAIIDETRAVGLDHKIMDDMLRLIAAHMKICARQFKASKI